MAQCIRLQALSMCVCEKQEQIRIFVPRLINCCCSFCTLHVDQRVSTGRGAGAAAAVGSGRTLLDFFKPKSATDGAKESPVLMDSSSGGGASDDADVVATGVVNRGEGGAGACMSTNVCRQGGVLVPRRRWGAGARCWIFANRRAPRTARRSRRC